MVVSLLPLPEGDLSHAALADWVALHEPYGEDLHRRADVVAHLSQIRSPGTPDPDLATEFWWGLRGVGG